jgi:hypothetical protein
MGDSQKQHRHSIRLRQYDYGQPGAYFVTLCTHHRGCLFGEIVKGEMHLSKTGLVGQSVGEELPQRYPYTDDVNMIMPQMGD